LHFLKLLSIGSKEQKAPISLGLKLADYVAYTA